MFKHTVYKVTNKLNGKFYIGAHSQKDNEDLYAYMGSGKLIIKVIRKYGKENFIKEILFSFDTPEEMFLKEAELITEDLINSDNCYNLTFGGDGGFNIVSYNVQKEKVFRRNIKTNKWQWLNKDSITDEWVQPTKDKVVVKWADGRNNNYFSCDVKDPLFLDGTYIPHNIGTFTAKDVHGNFIKISKDDERFLSGELSGCNKDMVVVKWKDNRNDDKFQVSKTDNRYISGELVSIMCGVKRSDETKLKLSEKAKTRVGKYVWVHNPLNNAKTRILRTDVDMFLKLTKIG